MNKLAAVVLAAGKGTRMKSKLPKVLHRVGGKQMVARVISATEEAGVEKVAVIIGFGGEKVREDLGEHYEYVLQEEQLGTGHAVRLAEDVLRDAETVLVVCGDTPLLRAETLANLYQCHLDTKAAATILTTMMENPTGYGRIIRRESGEVSRIVEEKDANMEEKAVREINTGTYCFRGDLLWQMLGKINCQNAQGEYYLTDVIGLMTDAGEVVAAACCEDADETLGVNSRQHLALAEKILQRRVNDRLMSEGVTLIDPEQVRVDEEVQVGRDTVLEPGTILRGKTVIGCECHIGPHTELDQVTVGDGTHIHRSYAHECEVGSRAEIGPYVHLRPATKVGDGVRIGNFVEVKNTVVGDGTKLSHLSYLGDADIGSGVNVGCGTITVNYDGRNKYRTTIEDGAFVGCNSNLIAPVVIGKQAYVGAGSTISKDVPERALAVGRAKQINKENWVKDNTYKK